MSWHYYGSGESKGEIAARLGREIAKRREKGEPFHQVEVEGGRGMPAKTFWGNAWCENLESYRDYEYRLPRGRAYLRQGNVYDLVVAEGEVFAYVTGSEIYDVMVNVEPLKKARWKKLKAALAGEVGNLVDLLGGRLGAGVMGAVTDREGGLFPSPKEIRMNCSCPDWAEMCKHVAAVLYGVGVMLDDMPELLFELRGVNPAELVSAAVAGADRLGELVDGSVDVLEAGELSELFGIEITDPESAF